MKDKMTVGWQEWCALPDLRIPAIKAKVDTGAKTSSLHAFDIEPYRKNRKKYVKFTLHPIQNNDKIQVVSRALVIDERDVISSNGHKERRYVIETALELGDYTWDIEITLSNRDLMKFRMLLGREALAGQVVVDPAKKVAQDTLEGRPAVAHYK
jgi:ribosomal protein S6--L-glutamate ligase